MVVLSLQPHYVLSKNGEPYLMFSDDIQNVYNQCSTDITNHSRFWTWTPCLVLLTHTSGILTSFIFLWIFPSAFHINEPQQILLRDYSLEVSVKWCQEKTAGCQIPSQDMITLKNVSQLVPQLGGLRNLV